MHYLTKLRIGWKFRHGAGRRLLAVEAMISGMDAITHKASTFDAHPGGSCRERAGNARRLPRTGLYRTIPVVAAWQAVEEAAKREGYEFFTPSTPGVVARNPKNNNGGTFAEAFKGFLRAG
ncbi:MAG: hypothetical protein U1F83_00600 [Verrucomicrobiota bacterium]